MGNGSKWFLHFLNKNFARPVGRVWRKSLEHPVTTSVLTIPGLTVGGSIFIPPLRPAAEWVTDQVTRPLSNSINKRMREGVASAGEVADKQAKKFISTIKNGLQEIVPAIRSLGAAGGEGVVNSTKQAGKAITEVTDLVNKKTQQTANKISSIFGEGLDNAFKKYALPGLVSIGAGGAAGYLTDYLASGMPKGRRNLLTAMTSGTTGALTYIGIKMAQRKGYI